MTAHRLFLVFGKLGPFCLGAALLVAAYWQGLHGTFFFDDEANILLADGLKLNNFSLESIRQVLNSGIAGPLGRPVSQLSFALNYYFSGFSPFAFKATNLVIHGLNGLLVFFIAQHLIRDTHPKLIRRDRNLLAGFVAASWLLHPIQITSVLYVVQRMTSLSALFLFAAVLLHVAARQRKKQDHAWIGMLFLAWTLLWPLSVFSKESGILFPCFVAAYELMIRRNAHGRLDGVGRIIIGLLGAAIMAGGVYLLLPHANWLWSWYDLRPFSLYERLLTEARVIWMYLGLIFLPRPELFALYHDDLVISSGLLNPSTTLPALIGLCVALWLAWRIRIQLPIMAFAIAWFLVGHSLESTVLPLEIAHEHRNYVALFGIMFLPIAAWPNAFTFTGKWRTAGIALLTATLVYFALITAMRAHQFGNEVRRTQVESMYHPDSPRTNYEAGLALARELSTDPNNLMAYVLARKHYEIAGKLDANFKHGLLGLIHLNCITDQKVERIWVDELSGRLQKTLLSPRDRTLLFSLKEMEIAHTLCLTRPDMQMIFSAAFSNPTVSPPFLAMFYSWYADYLMLRENDLPAAKVELGKSLQLVPENPSNQLKWAQLILLEGRRDEAAQLLKALRNVPLSSNEKKTAAKLLACLEGDNTQCGKI